MKCFSENEIETFCFHDAGLKEIKFDTDDITTTSCPPPLRWWVPS